MAHPADPALHNRTSQALRDAWAIARRIAKEGPPEQLVAAIAQQQLGERLITQLERLTDTLAGPIPLVAVFDGNGILCRKYHGMGPAANWSGRDGRPVGALGAAVKEIVATCRELGATHAVVALDDPSRRYWRHDEWSAYKSGRSEHPPQLTEQLSRLPLVLKSVGITSMMSGGMEADDIIGSLIAQNTRTRAEWAICSSDKDLQQLVGPDSWVYDDGAKIGEAEVWERWGVTPARVPDWLALAGDAADGIPGAPGFGPVKVSALLGRWVSLEGLFDNLEALSDKQRETLEPLREQLLQFRRLTTIRSDVTHLPPVGRLALPLEWNPDVRAAITTSWQEAA